MNETKADANAAEIQIPALGKLKNLVSQLEDVIKSTKDAANDCKADIPTFEKLSTELNQCEKGCKSIVQILNLLDVPDDKEKLIKAEAPSLTNGEIAVSSTSSPANMTPPASEAGYDDDLAPMASKLGLTPSRISLQNSGKKRYRRGPKTVFGHKKKRKNLITNYIEKASSDVKVVKEESEEEKENENENEEEFEVEHILDYKRKQGGLVYQVRWRNYNADDDTWEPAENLTGCGDVYRDFLQQKIREKINAFSKGTKITEVPRDPKWVALLHEAFQREIFHPTESDWQEAISKHNSAKPLKLKSMKELHDDMDKALVTTVKIKFDSYVKNVVEQLTFMKCKDRREIQQAELRTWERNINKLCNDPAKLEVENLVDYDLPPKDFRYINASFAGKGVTIPTDPVVGCECTDCISCQKECCPKQAGSHFAYNRYHRLKISLGTAIYECNSLCKCGPDCHNRVVQKGRRTNLCIFKTANSRGWGVKAKENIKKDTFLTEYVGEVITTAEAERRGKIYDARGCTYLFDLDINSGDNNEYVIDAAKVGNVSHFINHSCDPNLVVYNVWVDCLDPELPRLALFAVQDIKKGEELTFDYNSGLPTNQDEISDDVLLTTPVRNGSIDVTDSNYIRTPKSLRGLQTGKTKCSCGAKNCRGTFF